MNQSLTGVPPSSSRLIDAVPFYYGWVHVVIGAVAMSATLPGRTHGLGLITESLIADLGINATTLAGMNFVSALVGAAFCIPVGWAIDRHGVRVVLSIVTAMLGASVLMMSRCDDVPSMMACLTLVRGFGQSSLSLVSLSVVSKWFQRRLGTAMGAFAVLLTFGFVFGVLAMGSLIQQWQWRSAWSSLGWTLMLITPLFWGLTRSTPDACGLAGDAPAKDSDADHSENQVSLSGAIRSPAFWMLVVGAALFNFVWSAVTLFNESIMRERDINATDAASIMAILAGVGLVANLVAGPLASRRYVLKLLGVGLMMLAVALVVLTGVEGLAGARLYALAIGSSGGVITVVFFAAWRHYFGTLHLGRIQGTAQVATVIASASGPVAIAFAHDQVGAYQPVFRVLAIIATMLAVMAWMVRK